MIVELDGFKSRVQALEQPMQEVKESLDLNNKSNFICSKSKLLKIYS